MDDVSNLTKHHTKPNQTKPTVNLLKNSHKKLDFYETFSVASDGCCLKPDQTISYQTNCKSSLKQQKTSKIFMKFSQKLQMDVVSNLTKPNYTKPYQTKLNKL